jgi:hypothetical protein
MAQYTEEQRENALGVRAVLGDDDKASEALAEMGQPVPAATIGTWRRKYRDRFLWYQESRMNSVRQEIVATSLHLLHKRFDLAETVLAKLAVRVDEEDLTAGQLSYVMRGLETGIGIGTDKIQNLSADAVAPAEREGYHALIERLAKHGAITVEAEEVTVEAPKALAPAAKPRKKRAKAKKPSP